jgi:hypothetical protein
LPDTSIRTTFIALVTGGIASVRTFFATIASPITEVIIQILVAAVKQFVEIVGFAVRKFIGMVFDMLPYAIMALFSAAGQTLSMLLSLLGTVLSVVNLDQLMLWIAIWYFSGNIIHG